MNIVDGTPTYDVMNASGGVQSTTMFRMVQKGDLPRPDCAIFADTGWERQSSYQMIQSLIDDAKEMDLPFHVVGNGNVRRQAIESGNTESDYGDWRDDDGYGFLKMPIYTIDQRGNKPKMSNKQCTTEFKIRPIRKFLREHYGTAHFKQWIGISLDEAKRMRRPKEKYLSFWYPLVDMRWARGHCIEYLKSHGFPIPTKSSCIGCPLHGEQEWHSLTESEKADAIEFDEKIRHMQAHYDVLPKPKKIPDDQLTLIDMNEVEEYAAMHPLERRQEVELYAHTSGQPLRDVLSGSVEVQETLLDLEDDDCGGNCFI